MAVKKSKYRAAPSRVIENKGKREGHEMLYQLERKPVGRGGGAGRWLKRKKGEKGRG